MELFASLLLFVFCFLWFLIVTISFKISFHACGNLSSRGSQTTNFVFVFLNVNHNVNSNYKALILSVGNLAGFQKLDRASCSSNTFCEGGRQDLSGLLTTVETNNTEKDSRRKVGLKTISSKLLEAVRVAESYIVSFCSVSIFITILVFSISILLVH